MPTILKILGALYLFLNFISSFSIQALITGILVFLLLFYAGQLLQTLYDIRDKLEIVKSAINQGNVQEHYAGKMMMTLNEIKDLLQRNKTEE